MCISLNKCISIYQCTILAKLFEILDEKHPSQVFVLPLIKFGDAVFAIPAKQSVSPDGTGLPLDTAFSDNLQKEQK